MADDKKKKVKDEASEEELAAAKASKGKVAHEAGPSIFKSKPAIIAYVVFGFPAIALLLWYFYNVAHFVDKEGMESMEANLQAKLESQLAKLKKRAKVEGFRLADYDACKNIQDSYTTPKGYNFADADINQLVGISSEATDDQRSERCVTIAKSVYKMEKTSHHTKHVTVCAGGRFQIGGAGVTNYWIKPDPKGRGALQNFNPRNKQLVRIRKGNSTILSQWQIYNMGDGCIIVGLSKSGVFEMSGKAVRKEAD